MRYVLALDQGTTSSRAIVFDEDGRAVASAQREFEQHYPQPGWVEHDPLEIYRTQRETAREAVAKSKVPLKQLMALGITNQRETTLLWDRQSGEPLHQAIVWQDRRTAPLCDELRAVGAESLVRERTGLVIDPYFSGTKIAWLLDNVPGARPRAERGELAFGTVDTWLVWHLTGNRTHVTDPSNASRTMLFNIHANDWDDELLKLLRVPRAILPEVHPSAHAFGALPAALIGEPLIIGGIAGDQQAAMFGQMCHRPGTAKNTYGTGCFMLMHTGDRVVLSQNGLVSTSLAQTKEKEFALEGSVFIAGAVVQWLRDQLEFFASSAEVEKLAASQKDSGQSLTELRVDGGAAANDLLMQFQADLLGVPVLRPKVLETTALGAAYLAGLTVNLWKSRDELAAHWQLDRRFEPCMARDEAQAKLARWRDAVTRARHWAKPA